MESEHVLTSDGSIVLCFPNLEQLPLGSHHLIGLNCFHPIQGQRDHSLCFAVLACCAQAMCWQAGRRCCLSFNAFHHQHCKNCCDALKANLLLICWMDLRKAKSKTFCVNLGPNKKKKKPNLEDKDRPPTLMPGDSLCFQ